MNDPARYGLPERALEGIAAVFAQHPAVREVLIYGSRARGEHRPASDIDLALVADSLSSTEMAAIEQELDDLLLPWTIDLLDLEEIEDVNLRNQIDRWGRVIYPGPLQLAPKRAGEE